MKEFRDKNNMIYPFDGDCFDVDGKCINEYALKVIEENSLIEITKEEAEAIRNYKSPEQIAEEERISKLPTTEEQEKMKIELILINLLEQGGMI